MKRQGAGHGSRCQVLFLARLRRRVVATVENATMKALATSNRSSPAIRRNAKATDSVVRPAPVVAVPS